MKVLEKKGVIITGTGSVVPETQLNNHQLAQILETSDEWITTRTGIHHRHLLSPQNSLSAMATVAAQKAIAMAGIAPVELDLIILATSTPDDLFGKLCFIAPTYLAISN